MRLSKVELPPLTHTIQSIISVLVLNLCKFYCDTSSSLRFIKISVECSVHILRCPLAYIIPNFSPL